MDEQTWNIQRFEAEGRANFNRWSVSMMYGNYAPQPELGYLTRREGILTSGSIKLATNWVVTGSARWDLEANKINQYVLGAGYVDDCFVLAANYVTSYSYSAGTTPPVLSHAFLFQIGLRTLATSSGTSGSSYRRRDPIASPAHFADMRATTMTTRLPVFRLPFFVLGAVLASALVLAGAPARAQNIVVMVNGDPITDFDIEQRSKLDQLTSQKTPGRQDVINTLIDDKIKLKEGKKYGVDPGASDINGSYEGMAQRMRISPDQLTKSLESKGVRPETLKNRMRSEMVWTSLVRGRFKEKLLIGEKDVADKVREGGEEKLQIEGTEYKMQPIVLIVPRGASPAFQETRMKEAEQYRSRVGSCEEANSLFRSTPNATIRDSVTKTTADLPEALRKVLDDTAIGHLTAPEVTKSGIEMVVLCSRKPTTIDTPKKREIREKMYTEKYEKTQRAYLDELRKAAMIEYRNH